jgi:hypothetical protein
MGCNINVSSRTQSGGPGMCALAPLLRAKRTHHRFLKAGGRAGIDRALAEGLLTRCCEALSSQLRNPDCLGNFSPRDESQ